MDKRKLHSFVARTLPALLKQNLFIRNINFWESHVHGLSLNVIRKFDVFSAVHFSIELFHLPTLMHNYLFINKCMCMLHYYLRHVSSINMPIFRTTNCIHTASGIVVLCKRPHSTPVESRLSGVCSQPVYCVAVYRERRYQMLCECNWSSWRWAC